MNPNLGGLVIEVAYEKGDVWVRTRAKSGKVATVFIKEDSSSRCVSRDDELYWSPEVIEWYPRDSYGRRIYDFAYNLTHAGITVPLEKVSEYIFNKIEKDDEIANLRNFIEGMESGDERLKMAQVKEFEVKFKHQPCACYKGYWCDKCQHPGNPNNQ